MKIKNKNDEYKKGILLTKITLKAPKYLSKLRKELNALERDNKKHEEDEIRYKIYTLGEF